jgi:hypothetical protein
MSLRKISIALTSGVALAAATPAFAQSNGNTVGNNNVVNALGSRTPITVNNSSNSRITNPGSANVHLNNTIVVSGSGGRSTVNNNVNHQGSIGASPSVVVDLRNPAANAPVGRQNARP